MTPDIKSRIDALTPDAGLQHVPAKAGQAEEFHTLVRRSDMHAAIEAVLGARSTAAQPVEPTGLQQVVDGLVGALNEIGDYAHDHSTGPAAPDTLWEIRGMAYVACDLAAAPPAASGDSTPPSAPVQGDPSGALRPEPEAAGQGPRAAAIERLRETLTRTARWVGQFPATGRFWDDDKTDPMSYGAVFGSNGERDYMRSQAVDALIIVDDLFPEPPQAASGCSHTDRSDDQSKVDDQEPTTGSSHG